MIDPDTLAEMEFIVGKINGKLTTRQALGWAKYMASETDKEFTDALGDSAAQFFSPRYGSHWLANPAPGDEQAEAFAAAMIARSSHAMKFFLKREQTADFIQYIRATKRPGFAGDKCPDLFFPTTNSWFEVAFVPGQYPGVAPLNDHSAMGQLRIANIAIHAVHQGSMIPDYKLGVRDAQILAFVTDAVQHVHTFAGYIQYGTGGAVMHPVRDHAEAIRSFSGLPPHAAMMPTNGAMSNMSQFVCGTLANLIGFYIADGGDLLSPITEGTNDVAIRFTESD